METNTSSSRISNSGIPSNTAFIIDTYSPYSPYNNNVRSIFWLNERQFCIREIECDWGRPIIHSLIDDEARPEDFYLYNTFEEAQNFAHTLRRLNK